MTKIMYEADTISYHSLFNFVVILPYSKQTL